MIYLAPSGNHNPFSSFVKNDKTNSVIVASSDEVETGLKTWPPKKKKKSFRMPYRTGVCIAPSGYPSSVASHVKNGKASAAAEITSDVEKNVPSSADKKRYAATLRKIRWTIYESILSKKKDVLKSIAHYKKKVGHFLQKFSKMLKLHEIIIWKEKVTKTFDDGQTFHKAMQMVKPCLVKNSTEKPRNECTCTAMLTKCMERIDSALGMFSAILKLVEVDQSQTKKKINSGNNDEVPICLNAGIDIVTTEQVNRVSDSEEEIDVVSQEEAATKLECDKNVTDVIAAPMDVLKSDKSSERCFAMPMKEEFRKNLMAYYSQSRQFPKICSKVKIDFKMLLLLFSYNQFRFSTFKSN